MKSQTNQFLYGSYTAKSTWYKKIIAWCTLVLITTQPILVSAEVVADPNGGGNKPIVGSTANGLPVVQITTPSTAGVSRNLYQTFNVDQQGLILNNSGTLVQTQLAGYITGNPFLANGSARVILNEVTSSNPTYLRGYTEIAGQKAELVIANPNGITGDGFGFINASRAILTTGTPIFGGTGSLDAFRVVGGQIAIEGAGMNGSNVDQIDLISRTTAINAQAWANYLTVVAGTNTVDYATLHTQDISVDGTKPQVAIDVGNVGGMYAQKIYLVGTENGVGVNTRGAISASNGDVVITSKGQVLLAGSTSASANIKVTAQGDINNQNNVYAQGNTTMDTQGTLINSTIIASGQHTTLTGKNISSLGIMVAGVNSDGTYGSAGDLTLTASQGITASAQNKAAGSLSISAASINLSSSDTYAKNALKLTATAGDIINTGGAIATNGELTLKAQNIKNSQGSIVSQKDMTINVASLNNSQGSIVSHKALTIDAQGAIDNSRQGYMEANSGLQVTAQSLNNQTGKILNIDASDMSITKIQNIDNQSGTIGSNGKVDISAQTLNNQNGKVIAQGNLAITTLQGADNTSGTIFAKQNLNINQSNTNLNNTNGSIGASKNVIIQALATTNTSGKIVADQDVQLTTQNLNGDGKIQAGQDMTLHLTNDVSNLVSGEITANRDLAITADTSLTNQGNLSAVGKLTLTGSKITNDTTGVLAGTTLSITTPGTITNKGLIEGSGVDLSAQDLQNTGSVFGDRVIVTAEKINNTGATAAIAGTQGVGLYARTSLENSNGANIYSGGNLVIAGSSDLDNNNQYKDRTGTVLNQSAVISADGNMGLYADQLTNKKSQLQLESQTTRTTVSENIPFSSPYYRAHRTYTTTVDQTVATQDSPIGQILSGGNMDIKVTGTLENNASTIAAGGTLNYKTTTWNNIGYANTQTTTKDGTNYYIRNEKYCSSHFLGVCDGWDWRDVAATNRYYVQTSQALTGWAAIFSGNLQVTGQAVNTGNLTINPTSNLVGNMATTVTPGQNPGSQPVTNTGGAGNPLGSSFTLPSGGLFNVSTAPGQHYLIETNPQFANYKTFISSDYMMKQLSYDPEKTQKRLGDGFYEQKLVREQINQLTGRRFLDGFTSDEEGYTALMNNGVTYAKQFNLAVGISLTPEQMAKLTSNMVWLVEKVVDGQKVLVPIVYTAQAGAHDLQPSGAFILGKDVEMKSSGNATNSGVIQADNAALITGDSITNRGGTLAGGSTLQVTAVQDILNQSGTIKGGQVTLTAGRDIQSETVTEKVQRDSLSTTLVNEQASIKAKGNLIIQANRDVSLNGTQMMAGQDATITGSNVQLGTVEHNEHATTNQGESNYKHDGKRNIVSTVGAGGNVNIIAQNDATLTGTQVSAGNNIQLAAAGNIAVVAAKDHVLDDMASTGKASYMRNKTDDETVIASNLTAENKITVAAVQLPEKPINTAIDRGNVTLQASNISSKSGEVAIGADKDIIVQETTEKHETLSETRIIEEGFLSTKTTETSDHTLLHQVKGSTISGDKVNISSNSDLTVKASNVVGTNDVSLNAVGDVNITSAKETGADDHSRYEKTSGIFSGGGLGFTIGSKSEKTTNNEQTLAEVGSTIGSINGNVNITAGDNVTSAGTTFTSGKDLTIKGKEVTIDNTVNTLDSQSKYEFKQSGLTVSLGGGLVTSTMNVAHDLQRAGEVKDERLKALYEYKAVKDAEKMLESKGDLKKGVSLSVSIGSSKMTSEQTEHIETVNTSNINAGGNVNITATAGDVNLKGTKINAEDVTIDAKKNINIVGADNKLQTDGKTSSSSWALGASIDLSSKGVEFFGNYNSGKGNENGTLTTNVGSDITASDTLTLKSGTDTNIIGSQVKGDKVVVAIGGDLNIVSKQDTDDYTAKNQNSGFGFSTGATGGITGSIGQGKTDSTYNSVTGQAGIIAGKEGFDITVGKNTDLKGAVIASEATPDKNKLSTNTLTYSDIQNKAEYDSSSIGVSLNTKPDAKMNEQGLTPVIGVSSTGNADSTTKTAISPGTIEVRSNPSQDLSKLSRDTTGSLNALGKIFDKQTVKEQQELANLFGQEAFKAIGDLGLKTGSPEKVALDIFAGGLMAQLGGGSFASGAAGAGFNQLLMNELSKIKDPAVLQWASALVGTVAGKLVGGNALTGASTAVSETQNNWLRHYQQDEFAADLKNAKSDGERRKKVAYYLALSGYNIDNKLQPETGEATESDLYDQISGLKTGNNDIGSNRGFVFSDGGLNYNLADLAQKYGVTNDDIAHYTEIIRNADTTDSYGNPKTQTQIINDSIANRLDPNGQFSQQIKGAKFILGFGEGLKNKVDEIPEFILKSDPKQIDAFIAKIPSQLQSAWDEGLENTAVNIGGKVYKVTLENWKNQYNALQTISDPEERGMKTAELIADIGTTVTAVRSVGKAVTSFSEFGGTVSKESSKAVFKNIDEGLNFAATPAKHMENTGRFVPIQTLQDAIKSTKGVPDPRGSNAMMHYTTITKNGQTYNLEVLYDNATNSVYHFEYTRKAIGNLPAIAK